MLQRRKNGGPVSSSRLDGSDSFVNPLGPQTFDVDR